MKKASRNADKTVPDQEHAYFNSVEAMARLLTPDNRRLLALIRDVKPSSIAALAELSGRSRPNVARTLNKLQAIGFVVMETVGRHKCPKVVVLRVTAMIDPYSEQDVLTLVKEV